jgi:hypothetical protein
VANFTGKTGEFNMCMPGGDSAGKASKRAAEEARQREEQRRQRITEGTTAIDTALAPFNDEYFTGRQTAYTQNAIPQLDRQFNDAQKALVYALSRGGLLQSSIAAEKQRALNAERAKYESDINNAAVGFANEGRSNLEKTRSNLLTQLGATEDPSQAASAAAREAGLLSAPPTFDALGNFIFNTATGLENLSNRTTGGRGFVAGGPASYIGGSKGSSSVVRV